MHSTQVADRAAHRQYQEQVAARLRVEEPINSATHGIGFVLSIAGVVLLLATAADFGDVWQLAACAVYGGSLIAVYAASTLSHLFQAPRLRRLFRIVDQALIFLLIAGTYTPIAFTWLRHGHWWIVLALMWAIASAGFVSKAIFVHRIEGVSTMLHVLMGWLPVVTVKTLIDRAPPGLLWWMLAGGICYTVGTIFLNRDQKVPYFHAVWHLMVVAGSACHYWAILAYCTAVPVAS
ncbi:MAG: hemolysin III family protein [Pirellulales bacterium]